LAAPSRPPVIDYEGSDYQESFWEAGGRVYEDGCEALALRRLLPPGGQRLLEVGAGAGRNSPRYRGFEQVVLVDYSRTQLACAQNRLGGGGRYLYVAADAYRLPFAPAQFDAATMIRTLHHMADPLAALGQVRRALTPGGMFILEFANKQNIKAILRFWLRRQAWNPFDLAPVEFASLNFDFHPQAVRGWLQALGFAIQRQLTVSHFRLDALKRNLPTGTLVWLDGLAQLTGDWWQLSPSVFVRAKAAGAGAVGGALVFQCPECGHAPLVEAGGRLPCPACGRAWLARDGIYDFKEPQAAGG
jgi:SAM-dependent methyltransferase